MEHLLRQQKNQINHEGNEVSRRPISMLSFVSLWLFGFRKLDPLPNLDSNLQIGLRSRLSALAVQDACSAYDLSGAYQAFS